MQNYIAAFKKAFSNRRFNGTVLFVTFLCIFEEFFFDFPQTRFIQDRMRFDGPEIAFSIATTIGSFIVFYLFVWAALGSSRVFQVFYVFLFAVSAIVQYGFWRAVQRFMVTIDLQIAGATPMDTWKGASLLFFNGYCILPVVGLIITLFIFGERKMGKNGFLKLGAFFLFVILLTFSYRYTSRPLNLGVSLSSFYQTISRFAIDHTLPSRREIVSGQNAGTPRNNVVLVIDESIRGDHFSINGYERDTTPFLDKLADTEDGFYNFGLAVSSATCSYVSNALILTGARPGLDKFDVTMTYPTVFQYAKAMGYKTYYMDTQAKLLWNSLTDHDTAFIDVWLKGPDFGEDYESDFRAADRIAKIVSEGTGNFIVLNKRGVHFIYRETYPPELAVWLPLPPDHLADPTLISNPYDNGILYNINTFFERLLVNPDVLENTTILYTSDHGQTLFANHATWLHCKTTPEEATVPLILIGRNVPPLDTSYHASHSNILPTLLDLMGVPSEQKLHSYAPSLFSATENIATDYFFFDGSLRLVDFPDP